MTYKNEVQALYEKTAQQMGIEQPRLIFIDSDIKQALAWTTKITINTGLAELVFDDTEVVESVLAHELTHYRNKDTQRNYKNFWRLYSKKYKAVRLIHEIRASIGGYTYSGEKAEAHIFKMELKWKVPELHEDKNRAYKEGYPTSKQIAYYASRSNTLTVEIAEEILNDYCTVYEVENRERFIADVLRIAKV